MAAREWRGFARADLLAIAALLAIYAALVLPYDRLPMLMVDESRNALNALGMALHGHWLVPYYDGAPDHWNPKPPLLIWMIAALLRLGAPPLLALRLPSLTAAGGTLVLVWWFCRMVDGRRSGFLAGMILLTSSLYIGPHVARSGDYDALLSAFMTGQAVAFWIATETGDTVRIGAFAIFAACIVGAVMTKSIEGALLLPGLGLFAILRGRLPALLRDPLVWLLSLGAVTLCLGYYLTRTLYDPGYLTAVWHNELGGRFGGIEDRSSGGALYYVLDLLRRFEPGMLLLPLAGFSLASRDPRRHSASLLCLVSGAVVLLVISKAETKHYWYAAPMIPLQSIAGGMGCVDALRWWSRREPHRLLPGCRSAEGALFGMLACALVLCVMRNQVWSVRGLRLGQNDQFWYGNFLNGLRDDHAAHRLTVLDDGLPNKSGFVNYNPMLQFYAAWESHDGMKVALGQAGAALAPGSAVATCDPTARAWLRRRGDLVVEHCDSACMFGRIAGGPRGAGPG